MMNMKNDRKILSIFIVILGLIVLFSGTYAAFKWITSELQKTNIVFTVNGNFSCAADGGGDIASTSLVPASCTNPNYAIQREITVTPTIHEDGLSIGMDLWLNIDELGEGLSKSEYFRYALTTVEDSCSSGIISEGRFHGLSSENNDVVKLLDQQVYRSSTPKKYYLYIWIDPLEENNYIVDQSFSFSLGGSCNETFVVETPVLDEGMIPVTISETGVVESILSNDENWYNYNNQKWANMVLVKNELYDLSENQIDNTIYGSVFTDEGLLFDGIDDYVLLPEISLSSMSEFTFEVEFIPDVVPTTEIDLLANYQSGGGGVHITATGVIEAAIHNGSYVKVASSEKIQVGRRYLVNGVYDGSNISLYIDGQFITSTPVSGNLIDPTNNTYFALGCNPNGAVCSGGYFDGIIKSARIYNKALTAEQISNNYNGFKIMDNLLFDFDMTISKRKHYKENSHIVVPESDILGYYVWIPRYKYKIWTTEVSSVGNEQPIDIVFESKNDKMSLGTSVGEYRTHPAFWWDNDNDSVYDEGEMLPGIWVGKFETTGDATTPTVKPNASSLVSQNVSTQFTTSLLFAGGSMNTSTGEVTFIGNNIYGLTVATDSHMMKNSEWGAVAYLSHSEYGINEEVRINNYYANSSYLTGCGAATEDEAAATTCGIVYGSPTTEEYTYPQSTTGNISGIFDMSGGSWDTVMGNYNNMSGSSEFSMFPKGKYYDLYSSTDISTACDGGMCYGHALSETNNWYGDQTTFLTSTSQWVYRSKRHDAAVLAGTFIYSRDTGAAFSTCGYRSVLIPVYNYTVNFDANGGSLVDVSYTTVGEHEFVVPYDGEYQLEVWGAQGGNATNTTSQTGGYGGYSIGNIKVNSEVSLYLNIGGRGIDGTSTSIQSGGYNGGGGGLYHGGSGGGATHISLLRGELKTLSSIDDLDKILIVAGGGGGAGATNEPNGSDGGHGGGFRGNDAIVNAKTDTVSNGYGTGGSQILGGTQSANGSSHLGSGGDGTFGIGATSTLSDSTYGSGGGGGGYYGGGSSTLAGGGGGSGYIGNNLLTNKYMYCYNCTISNDENTKTYTTTNVSSSPVANYAKSGNGAVRISQPVSKGVEYMKSYGHLPTPTREGYVFQGWYTELEGGEKVTSDRILDKKENIRIYAHWEKEPTLIFDVNVGNLTNISYTLTAGHEFIVPYDGEYKVELWGASGGGSNGGKGGYTSGIISLSKDEELYIYVGGQGPANASITNVGGYNGGGYSGNNSAANSYGGGGATDVRLNGGLWNDPTGINSRIMVAAGGGGGTTVYTTAAGTGGGLIGGSGTTSYSNYNNSTYLPIGANQTGAGYAYGGTARAGSFGYSIQSISSGAGGGGGGGYYGGNTGYGTTGSGGSSYISGHTGCVAITSESDITPKSGCITGTSDNSCSVHYSKKVFTDTVMIDGTGYNWRNVKASLQQMPNPNGGYYASGAGHSGAGVAKISQSSSKKVEYMKKYGNLPTPTREGYTFAGWYTELEGGIKVTKDTVVDKYGDINLYARWSPNNMIVTYSVNSGTITSSTTNAEGTTTYNWSTIDDMIYLNGDLYKTNISGSKTINLPNYNNINYINIVKEGYGVPKDEEWICLSGCKQENIVFDHSLEYNISDFCSDTQTSCDIVLGVNWVNQYTITYSANGGSGAPSSQIKTYGESIKLSSTSPTRTNYLFLGWSTSSSATSATYKGGQEYSTNGNLTLYAVWKLFTPLTSYKCANASKGSSPYHLQYTGNCTMVNDSNGNWRMKLLTSGTLTSIANAPIDVFLVGGGGGGGYKYGGGGGGGYTKTVKNYTLPSSVKVTIGAGGAAAAAGGSSKFGSSITVAGGQPGKGSDGNRDGGAGGSGGGSNYGNGGSNGGNGVTGGGTGGKGQGTTTREFGESSGTLYAGGGGGGIYGNGTRTYGGSGGGARGGKGDTLGSSASANTGGGGGGGGSGDAKTGGAGGSGIVVIRNKR